MTCTRSTTVIAALILCMALPSWGQQYLYAPQPVTSGQTPPSQDGILVQEIEIQKGDTLSALSRKFSGHGTYYPQILLFNSIKNPNLIYAGDTLKVPLSHDEPHGINRTDIKPTKTSHKHKASRLKKAHLKTGTQPPVRQSTGPSPISSPNTELSLSDLKSGGSRKIGAVRLKKKSAVPARKSQPAEYPVATESTTPSTPLPAAQERASTTSPAADTAPTGQKLFEAAVRSYRRDDCRTALEQFDRYLADNSGSPLAADANLYKAECYLKLSAQ